MPRPVPLPSTDYGSADEETNRLFRRFRQGTLRGTKIGIPGRSDSPQDHTGRWQPGPIAPRRGGKP